LLNGLHQKMFHPLFCQATVLPGHNGYGDPLGHLAELVIIQLTEINVTLNKICNWRFPWHFSQRMVVRLYVTSSQPNKIQLIKTLPVCRNGQRRLFYIVIGPRGTCPEGQRVSSCPQISGYCIGVNISGSHSIG